MLESIARELAPSADWILSAFLVFLFARSRFNTPARYSVSTTVWRFRTAAGCYYASVLMTFALLACIVNEDDGITSVFSETTDLPDVSAPVLAALLLTTLMPHSPLLSRVDEWLLGFFRDVGNIPTEVRLWRARLKKCDPVMSDEVRDEVSRLVATEPRLLAIRPEDLRFEPDGSPQYAYTKVLVLLSRIEHFETDRDFARVVEMLSDEYVAIRTRFEDLTVQAVRCFALMDGDPLSVSAESSSVDAVMECRRIFKEKCDELYGLMCELVAYGVLRSGRNSADRNARLVRLAFPVPPRDDPPFDFNKVVIIAFTIFVIVFAGISLLGGSQAGESHRTLIKSLMISVIYAVAILCAVLPKAGTPDGARGLANGERPVLAYLLWGVVAGLAAMAISVAFNTLIERSFMTTLESLQWKWPWFLMSFALAVTIAWLCDDGMGRDEEPSWLRWAEAVAAAGAMALTGAAVHTLLSDVASPDIAVPPFDRLVPLSAAIGLVVGGFVPLHYRRSRRSGRGTPGDEDLTPAAAAQPTPA